MQNKELQMFISTAFAGLMYYLGIVAIPIIMLICAMIIDYATGMSTVWYNFELSSKRGVKGIVKKVGYLALVVAAMILDWLISQGLQQINLDLHYSVFFAVLVTVWLIINELISTLESLSKMYDTSIITADTTYVIGGTKCYALDSSTLMEVST